MAWDWEFVERIGVVVRCLAQSDIWTQDSSFKHVAVLTSASMR